MFLACNIMFSLLLIEPVLAKSRLKTTFGISGQNEEMSGEIEEIKMRKKFIAAILFPIDSIPLESAQ